MKFWPNEEEQYGQIKVTQKSSEEKNGYIVYKFVIVGEVIGVSMVKSCTYVYVSLEYIRHC